MPLVAFGLAAYSLYWTQFSITAHASSSPARSWAIVMSRSAPTLRYFSIIAQVLTLRSYTDALATRQP